MKQAVLWGNLRGGRPQGSAVPSGAALMQAEKLQRIDACLAVAWSVSAGISVETQLPGAGTGSPWRIPFVSWVLLHHQSPSEALALSWAFITG